MTHKAKHISAACHHAGKNAASLTSVLILLFVFVQNKVNINDWSSVQSLFDKLNKQLEKTQKVTDALGVPRVYVRILVELEDGLKKTLADKDAKKKMSPTNAKALNTMRQRLKKHNVSFQEQIDKFRENPESTEEEPSDASDSDSGSDEGSDDEEEQEDLDVDGFEKVLLYCIHLQQNDGFKQFMPRQCACQRIGNC